MNTDLIDVVKTSKKARDQLIKGNISVKEANAISNKNHNVIGSYALDLRSRMFDAEMTSVAERVQRIAAE